MATGVPKIPPKFKPYSLIFFDEFGRQAYREKCTFKPDEKYVKEIAFPVLVRLVRKGKKNVESFTVAVVEHNVTVLGIVKDFVRDFHA